MDFSVLRWCKRILFGWSLKSEVIKVNCWFCDKNFEIDSKEKDQWTCPSCEQYNGFAEDGNYNKPITEVFERNRDELTQISQKLPVIEKPSILCRSCDQNQILKVRQLASFVPFEEAAYEEEVASYDKYLEHIYRLCSRCQQKVTEHLKRLHKYLKIEERSQGRSADHESSNLQTRNTSQDSSQLSFLSITFFSLSCASSFSLVLLQLRSLLEPHYRSSGGLLHLVYTHLDSVLYTVPVKNITHLEQGLIYLGASFCMLALFSVRKFSLLLVDAAHILLWLLSLLTCLLIAPVFLDSVHLGRLPSPLEQLVLVSVKVVISIATSLAAFICIATQRKNRNISTLRISRKPVSSEGSECSESESEMEVREQRHMKASFSKDTAENVSSSISSSSFVGDANNRFVPISSSPLPSPSFNQNSPSSRREPKSTLNNERMVPDSENVRQNLETFSLGLGKKSGSSSSIWSLPAVVSSSPSQSPDTTQKKSRQSPLNRSLLSPSRLGFLHCHPPLPENAGAFTVFHASDASQWRDSHANDSCQDSNSKGHFPSYEKSPKTKFDETMQCDSSTTNLESMKGNVGKKIRSSERSSKKQDFIKPDSSSSFSIGMNGSTRQVRRSSRIAMQGKIIRPWPLKKSFSFNSTYDCRNAERAGPLARERSRISLNQTGGVELPPSSLHSLRAGHAFRRPESVTNSGHGGTLHDRMECTDFALRRGSRRRILDYSDDEDEREEEEFKKEKLTEKRSSQSFTSGLKGSWLTWMSLLFGFIIGISITTNAFLLWMVFNIPGT